jgi:hypothetical protein
MEITQLIAHAAEWTGNKGQIRRAISAAEGLWNSRNDNTGVVEKIITNDDLLAVDGSDEMKAFVASLQTEPGQPA